MSASGTPQSRRVIVVLWRATPNMGIEFFTPNSGAYLERMSLRVDDMQKAAVSVRAWLMNKWLVVTRANAHCFVRDIDGSQVVAITFGLSGPEQRPLSTLGTWQTVANLMAVRHPGLPVSLLSLLSIEFGRLNAK